MALTNFPVSAIFVNKTDSQNYPSIMLLQSSILTLISSLPNAILRLVYTDGKLIARCSLSAKRAISGKGDAVCHYTMCGRSDKNIYLAGIMQYTREFMAFGGDSVCQRSNYVWQRWCSLSEKLFQAGVMYFLNFLLCCQFIFKYTYVCVTRQDHTVPGR